MRKQSEAPKRMRNDAAFPPDLPLDVSLRTMSGPYPAHSHEFYELEFILAGSGTHRLNGRETPIGANSFYLLTPADVHAIVEVTAPIRYYNIMFSREWLGEPAAGALFSRMRPLAGAFDADAAAHIAGLIESMLREFDVFDEHRQAILGRLLNIILCNLFRALPQSEPHAGGPMTEIQRALQYIEGNFRSRMRMRDAAQYVHMSPSYFSLQFKKRMGMPFSSYVNALRLEYARNLLHASAMPVGEICDSAGFGSAAHFIRSFRARYGCSPGEARLRAGNSK